MEATDVLPFIGSGFILAFFMWACGFGILALRKAGEMAMPD
jgi:hypothetical protein